MVSLAKLTGQMLVNAAGAVCVNIRDSQYTLQVYRPREQASLVRSTTTQEDDPELNARLVNTLAR